MRSREIYFLISFPGSLIFPDANDRPDAIEVVERTSLSGPTFKKSFR
jgi:hypothetical protein